MCGFEVVSEIDGFGDDTFLEALNELLVFLALGEGVAMVF